MYKGNFIIYSLLLLVSFLFTSCSPYEKMNPALIEKLNSQIKSEEYEKIYAESSRSVKGYKYSKEELIERLKFVREKMKEVDETLQFQQFETRCGDEGVYRADNFACRFIEKNGRRIDIDFWLDAGNQLKLLDICVYSKGMDDKFCVTDISRS